MHEKKSIGLLIGVLMTLVAAHGMSTSQQNDKRAGQFSAANPANSWKTLVPLRATRTDVERMFGKPEDRTAGEDFYTFQKEKVAFTYARGTCGVNDRGWKVAPGVILEILIIPQTDLLLAETGFDLTKFRRTESYHPTATIYESPEEGVTITTRILRVAEEVMSIKLEPSIRELEFACPKNKPEF